MRLIETFDFSLCSVALIEELKSTEDDDGTPLYDLLDPNVPFGWGYCNEDHAVSIQAAFGGGADWQLAMYNHVQFIRPIYPEEWDDPKSDIVLFYCLFNAGGTVEDVSWECD